MGIPRREKSQLLVSDVSTVLIKGFTECTVQDDSWIKFDYKIPLRKADQILLHLTPVKTHSTLS